MTLCALWLGVKEARICLWERHMETHGYLMYRNSSRSEICQATAHVLAPWPGTLIFYPLAHGTGSFCKEMFVPRRLWYKSAGLPEHLITVARIMQVHAYSDLHIPQHVVPPKF